MHTLILGATGYIGGAILDHMIQHGHPILALARSDGAERELIRKGARVIRGDLRDPAAWSGKLLEVEGVIHVAATFTDDMGEVDRRLVDALLAVAKTASRKIRFVYTGGCWLYGATGDAVATENSRFDPLPAFAWMVENGNAVLGAPWLEGIMVHPAMVYDRNGGAVSGFLSGAGHGGPIEVIGALETRWPLVHRDDLAAAYRLVLERGAAGESYNVSAEQGVRVGDLVRVIAERHGLAAPPLVRGVPEAVAAYGAWAAGPALDQQMSGRKIAAQLGWRPLRCDALSELA